MNTNKVIEKKKFRIYFSSHFAFACNSISSEIRRIIIDLASLASDERTLCAYKYVCSLWQANC